MYGKTALEQPIDNCPPHFEGLPSVAERAEIAADRIQRFIDRFHGDPEQATAAVGQLAHVPCGHLGQLQRLELAVSQFERLASGLDLIG